MSVFEKYKRKRPAEFTRLVGVNYGTFQIILKKLENEITRYKQQKPMRTRGLKSSLTIADQLLRWSSFSAQKTVSPPLIFNSQFFFKFERAFIA